MLNPDDSTWDQQVMGRSQGASDVCPALLVAAMIVLRAAVHTSLSSKSRTPARHNSVYNHDDRHHPCSESDHTLLCLAVLETSFSTSLSVRDPYIVPKDSELAYSPILQVFFLLSVCSNRL